MIYQITEEQRQQLLAALTQSAPLGYSPTPSALRMLNALAPVDAEPVAWMNQHGVIHEAGYAWGADNQLTPLFANHAPQADALEIALDPRRWTREMSAAWHQNIPDLMAAFAALRGAAVDAGGGA